MLFLTIWNNNLSNIHNFRYAKAKNKVHNQKNILKQLDENSAQNNLYLGKCNKMKYHNSKSYLKQCSKKDTQKISIQSSAKALYYEENIDKFKASVSIRKDFSSVEKIFLRKNVTCPCNEHYKKKNHVLLKKMTMGNTHVMLISQGRLQNTLIARMS